MWLHLKVNVRRQFKATLQRGACKGKVSKMEKSVDVQYDLKRTSKEKNVNAIMNKLQLLWCSCGRKCEKCECSEHRINQ